MRTFNLIALTLAFAGVSILGACALGEYFLGDDAKYIVLPFGLILGMSARRLMEKVVGYTLLESMKDGQDGQN